MFVGQTAWLTVFYNSSPAAITHSNRSIIEKGDVIPAGETFSFAR